MIPCASVSVADMGALPRRFFDGVGYAACGVASELDGMDAELDREEVRAGGTGGAKRRGRAWTVWLYMLILSS